MTVRIKSIERPILNLRTSAIFTKSTVNQSQVPIAAMVSASKHIHSRSPNQYWRLILSVVLPLFLYACGGGTATETNVINQAPIITSSSSISVNENNISTGYIATAKDVDSSTLTFSLITGNDTALFNIESQSGVLSFNEAPDFEVPKDSDGNNAYSIELSVSDGTLNVSQTVIITVLNTPESSAIPTGIENILVRTQHFFVANDGIHGKELWITDGTENGTIMVKDINPDGDSKPSQLTYLENTLYFSAKNGTHGRELWKSDGTEGGTTLVLDVNPSGNAFIDDDAFITTKGSYVYFFATDGINGYELWKSDGSSEGTTMVKDIGPNEKSGLGRYHLFRMGDNFYFSGYSDVGRCALWKSDGTENGTVLVKHFSPTEGPSCPDNFTNVKGSLFFTASDKNYGDELWKTDGTEVGTTMVKDIDQFLYYGSTPSGLTAVDDKLYFSSEVQYIGRELWVSDGTETGTELVADIALGEFSSSPSEFIHFNGNLFFEASEFEDCYTRIWKSDGTSDGTKKLSDCMSDERNKELDSLSSTYNGFKVFNDNLYFIAGHKYGDDLWISDGSEFGTKSVTNFDFNPSISFALDSYNTDTELLVFPDNRFLIKLDDHIHGLELWITDSTNKGTMLIKDVNPDN